MGDFAGVVAGLVADADELGRGVGIAGGGAVEEAVAEEGGGGKAEGGVAAEGGQLGVGPGGGAFRGIDEGELGGDAGEAGGWVEVGGIAAGIGGADGGSLAGEGDEAEVVIEAADFAAFPPVGLEDGEALALGDGGFINGGDEAVAAAVLALELGEGGAAEGDGGGASAFAGAGVGLGVFERGEVRVEIGAEGDGGELERTGGRAAGVHGLRGGEPRDQIIHFVIGHMQIPRAGCGLFGRDTPAPFGHQPASAKDRLRIGRGVEQKGGGGRKGKKRRRRRVRARRRGCGQTGAQARYFGHMNFSRILVILGLVLAGCAVMEPGNQAWFKEGATESERQAAVAAAETQAKQARVQPAEERGIFLQAMTAQGWRLMPKGSAPSLATKPATPTRSPQRANTGGAL